MPALNLRISKRDHEFLCRYKHVSGLSMAVQARLALERWREAHEAECVTEEHKNKEDCHESVSRPR